MEKKNCIIQHSIKPSKKTMNSRVQLFLSPSITESTLQKFFDISWSKKVIRSFDITHQKSLLYIIAKDGAEVVGYLNVPHDGKHHAFIVDLAVHPTYRRKGIALAMLKKASDICRDKGYEWLHLDFSEDLTPLYQKAEFKIGPAGIIYLKDK